MMKAGGRLHNAIIRRHVRLCRGASAIGHHFGAANSDAYRCRPDVIAIGFRNRWRSPRETGTMNPEISTEAPITRYRHCSPLAGTAWSHEPAGDDLIDAIKHILGRFEQYTRAHLSSSRAITRAFPDRFEICQINGPDRRGQGVRGTVRCLLRGAGRSPLGESARSAEECPLRMATIRAATIADPTPIASIALSSLIPARVPRRPVGRLHRSALWRCLPGPSCRRRPMRLAASRRYGMPTSTPAAGPRLLITRGA